MNAEPGHKEFDHGDFEEKEDVKGAELEHAKLEPAVFPDMKPENTASKDVGPLQQDPIIYSLMMKSWKM